MRGSHADASARTTMMPCRYDFCADPTGRPQDRYCECATQFCGVKLALILARSDGRYTLCSSAGAGSCELAVSAVELRLRPLGLLGLAWGRSGGSIADHGISPGTV